MLELVVPLKYISAVTTPRAGACAVVHLVVWHAGASFARCLTEGDGPQAVLFWIFFKLFLQALDNIILTT